MYHIILYYQIHVPYSRQQSKFPHCMSQVLSSAPESKYTTTNARTLQGLKTAATKTTAKAKMGSQFQPLLEIPLERIIDKLHLLLRIFDILLRNVIYMVVLKVDQDESAQTHTDSLKKGDQGVWC